MRIFHRAFLFSFVICLVAGCSETQLQPESLDLNSENALKGAKVKPVPFKATFDLVSAESGPGDYPIYISGEGNATHLGKTSLSLGQIWYITTPPPWQGDGEFILTASNGDELNAVYTNCSLSSEDFVLFKIICDGVFMGGTGRFEDAEGSFSYEAYFYPMTTETGESKISGEIMY